MKSEISVIIATYNSKKLLEVCLESLNKQTLDSKKFEVIVVDDGSNDGTYSYFKKKKYRYKLKILKQNRKGPACARNLGVKNSSSKIVSFTDADCFAPKDWLKNILKGYNSLKDVSGIGGVLEPSRNNLIAKIEKLKNKYLHKITKETKVGFEEVPVGFTNNMSYKKSVFDKLKGFDESFSKPAGEDFELKQRACKKGYKMAFIDNPIIHMENYDLDYFLRQILKRGTEKKLSNMSNSEMIKEVIINLPEISKTLIKKSKGYKEVYNESSNNK